MIVPYGAVLLMPVFQAKSQGRQPTTKKEKEKQGEGSLEIADKAATTLKPTSAPENVIRFFFKVKIGLNSHLRVQGKYRAHLRQGRKSCFKEIENGEGEGREREWKRGEEGER